MKFMNRRTLSSRAAILAAATCVMAFLPLIQKNPYMMHLFIMCYINIVLGMSFSILFSTGLITLGAAAFYGIGAYTSAILVTRLDLSFWIALPAATIIAGVIALGLGMIIVRHAGMPFVIITLVFSMVVVQATGQIHSLGGWGGITSIPRPNSIGPVEFVGKTAYYYLILFLLLLISLVFYAFYSSRFGRSWQAIKLSPDLAESLGIHLYKYRLLAFVIASSAAGMVGSFYAHYIQSVTPEAFGGWISVYIQLYAVLGGLDFYILGPTCGALIMTFVPEFLRVAEELEPIITGALLLLIILFFPKGILGTLHQLLHGNIPNVFSRMTLAMNLIKSYLERD